MKPKPPRTTTLPKEAPVSIHHDSLLVDRVILTEEIIILELEVQCMSDMQLRSTVHFPQKKRKEIPDCFQSV